MQKGEKNEATLGYKMPKMHQAYQLENNTTKNNYAKALRV